jgi:hypothetical protein
MRKRMGCLFDVLVGLALLGVATAVVFMCFGSTNNEIRPDLIAPKPWYPGNQPSDPSTPSPMITTCPKGYHCGVPPAPKPATTVTPSSPQSQTPSSGITIIIVNPAPAPTPF